MLRATALGAGKDDFLVSNDLGEFAIVDERTSRDLATASLTRDHHRYLDFLAKGFIERPGRGGQGLERAVFETRKRFVLTGPSLHIFVVTLRCDHACTYCQVSRASLTAPGKDMSFENADHAVDRVFESPSPDLTIEFQGGEPVLRFDLIEYIVRRVEAKNEVEQRTISFSLVSTLHHLTDDHLRFCRDHAIHISTSIDGPAALHNSQRHTPGGDGWERTINQLERARSFLGHEGVVALPTVTRAALADPKSLVDTYVDLGFAAIFLRPLSPYGFARKTRKAIGYTMAEFLAFYEEALEYILTLNTAGVEIGEIYTSILLRHILTPFGSGYVDLRSPAGAGLGVLVYNYDGIVFPADEARMAAETGDARFALGPVTASLDDLLASPSMRWLATGAVAETLPGCRDCAFVPFCGADPVYHAAAQCDPVGDRQSSEFCQRHLGMFQILFRRFAQKEPEAMRTFAAWAFRRSRQDVTHAGLIEA